MVDDVAPAPLFEHEGAHLLEFGPLAALEHLVAIGYIKKVNLNSERNRNSGESVKCFRVWFQLQSLCSFEFMLKERVSFHSCLGANNWRKVTHLFNLLLDQLWHHVEAAYAEQYHQASGCHEK